MVRDSCSAAARSTGQQPSAAAAGAGSANGAAPSDWQVSDVAADDEDAPEIIIEPAGAPGGSRRAIQRYSASNATVVDGAAVGPGTGAGTAGPPGGAATGASASTAAGAPGAADPAEPSCLPGECQVRLRGMVAKCSYRCRICQGKAARLGSARLGGAGRGGAGLG